MAHGHTHGSQSGNLSHGNQPSKMPPNPGKQGNKSSKPGKQAADRVVPDKTSQWTPDTDDPETGGDDDAGEMPDRGNVGGK